MNKLFIIIFSVLLVQQAEARQYIQCKTNGETSDVAVVNLTTEKGGTLFLSSGMENPETERILVKIQFDRIENHHHYYKVIDEKGEGYAVLPSSIIGKASKYFEVELSFSGGSFDYSCFSDIYPN